MASYKDENITEKDINEIYDRMCGGNPKGIDFDNFKKHSI